jgi:Uma2 family endonuclease
VFVPTGFRSSDINSEVFLQLKLWSITNNSGKAVGPDAGFQLPNRSVRSPDAAWIARARIDALPPEILDRFLPLCPDFVVEVRSATDRLRDQKQKLVEYVDNGARLAWLIDPIERTVHVYRPGEQPVVIENPTAVSAEPELPGFTLDLSRIW